MQTLPQAQNTKLYVRYRILFKVLTWLIIGGVPGAANIHKTTWKVAFATEIHNNVRKSKAKNRLFENYLLPFPALAIISTENMNYAMCNFLTLR